MPPTRLTRTLRVALIVRAAEVLRWSFLTSIQRQVPSHEHLMNIVKNRFHFFDWLLKFTAGKGFRFATFPGNYSLANLVQSPFPVHGASCCLQFLLFFGKFEFENCFHDFLRHQPSWTTNLAASNRNSITFVVHIRARRFRGGSRRINASMYFSPRLSTRRSLGLFFGVDLSTGQNCSLRPRSWNRRNEPRIRSPPPAGFQPPDSS